MKFRLSILTALLFCGCRHIEYRCPDGRQLHIWSLGNDTKIGKLDATAPDGTVIHIENYDAQARAVDLAAEIIRKVPVPPVVP
jgi:hypothetical protein